MKPTNGKKILSVILMILAAVSIMLVAANKYYIDLLWFTEVGYTQVFLKEIVTRMQIGVPMFLVLTVILYFYFIFLKSAVTKRDLVVVTIKKKIALIPLAASIVLSFIITSLANSLLWFKLLEFLNASSFNTKDPVFGKDISFYVFKLPFLESLSGVLLTILFIVFIATLAFTALTFLSKGREAIQISELEIRKEEMKDFFIKFGQLTSKQIGIFAAIFFLLLSFDYYIRTFTILYSPSSISFGAGYTDIAVKLNLYRIQTVLCIAAAVLAVLAGFRKKFKLMLLGPIVLIAVSLIGGVAAFGLENYIVAPNQYDKEEPYLKKHIQYTQLAYGLDNVENKEFSASEDITLEDIKANDLTVKNIPINDYKPTLDMYNSIQGFRIYYEFNDIDIDRYMINKLYTQVFISAREMDNGQLEENAKNWINQHLKYTHGFGVAVSPVNKVNEVGQPDLTVKDIPPKSIGTDIEVTEPRIYFGESTDTYAITNCKTPEFDYPSGSDNKENFYEGKAGIKLTLFNRLAFAIREQNIKIILSTDITSDSKILINRNIKARLAAIAPFFSYDEDPYIVVSEGKLYWIVDAFTSSNRYPYSKPYNTENTFNYIRNSVKVVIDAYNGDVTFYQVDKDDPITNTYNKIYPGILKPISEMSEDLRSHVRYSQTMFDIQSDIYRTYHMNNTKVFYNKEDQWEVARQVYGAEKETMKVESAYLIMKLPDRDEEFTLMIPYTARQKDNMVAWMSAMNDGDDYGKLMVYNFPKQSLVYGPMQIEQRVDQDTTISPQLTLLGQQGSQVVRGNMLTIPIEEAILYVEPIYIKASDGDRALPELKKVIASYKNKIIMADSLESALEQIFGKSQAPQPNETPGEADKDVNSLITKANSLFTQAQEAQKGGDWAKYGELIKQLESVLGDLKALTNTP
ncbi:MAG: UPF0182 family protein [Eubacteriaceae bacterium]|nr:UPF0182 family protein [Eubacteriaceae bacterium]